LTASNSDTTPVSLQFHQIIFSAKPCSWGESVTRKYVVVFVDLEFYKLIRGVEMLVASTFRNISKGYTLHFICVILGF